VDADVALLPDSTVAELVALASEAEAVDVGPALSVTEAVVEALSVDETAAAVDSV